MAIHVDDAPTTAPPAIDEAKLQAFLGRAVGDMGALASAPLVLIGERLGLYAAMAEAGPVTPAELAERTDTIERYVREWLVNQAASGYVEYDPTSGRYTLPTEHALAISGLYGGFQTFVAAIKSAPRIAEAFRTGGGVRWGEHDPGVFEGTERFFRVGYQQHLVSDWIPALEGVGEKLRDGALVADVGCGHAAATIILAEAYPRSRFVGIDNHPASTERARRAAEQAGVADRIRFDVASAAEFSAPLAGYDLIAFFDAVHDLSDPVGAARQARAAIASDGTVLVVEPMAGERTEENLHPLGRLNAAASVLLCTTNSLADGGPGLGTLATERQLRELFEAAGFTRFRRTAETPFNRVFEVRP